MQEIINAIYKDKITALSFSASVGLWLVTLVVSGIFYFQLPPYVPVFNKMVWGYARLGAKWEFFLPLLLAALFLSVNSYIGIKLKDRLPLLTRFLFLTSLCISIFTSIFTIKILLIIL